MAPEPRQGPEHGQEPEQEARPAAVSARGQESGTSARAPVWGRARDTPEQAPDRKETATARAPGTPAQAPGTTAQEPGPRLAVARKAWAVPSDWVAPARGRKRARERERQRGNRVCFACLGLLGGETVRMLDALQSRSNQHLMGRSWSLVTSVTRICSPDQLNSSASRGSKSRQHDIVA